MYTFILRLPLDNGPLLDAWINAMGCDESFVPTENSFICSSHFSIDDYVLENGIYEINQSAIPSKNLRCDNPDINLSTVTNGNNGLNNCEESIYNTATQSYNKYIKQENNINVLYEPIPTPIVINLQANFPRDYNFESLNSNKGILSKNSAENKSMMINNISNNALHNSSNVTIDKNINNQIRNSSNIVESNTRITPKFKTTRNTILYKKNNQRRLNQMHLLANTNTIHNNPSSDVQIVEMIDDNINTSNYMSVPASIPLDSTNESTFHTHSTKKVISNSTNDSRGNQFNSNAWVTNPLYEYKQNLPNQFLNKLKLLARKNRRLVAKVKKLMTTKQDFLDTQIKYLELKTKVLETEEKLLQNGINTSEYPAFNLANDEEISKDNDIEYDVLVECKLNELNDKLPSNNNSNLQTTNYSTSTKNKNAM